MARPSYTAEQRAAAVEQYRTEGPTAVQRATGIPKGTVTMWAQQAGVQTTATAQKEASNQARRANLEQRRIDLADGLLADAQRLREQLFEPCTQRVVKTVGTGKGLSETAIVDVDMTEPSFADKRQIMTSIAIAVDKVQLLTGEATERVDHLVGRDEVLHVVDELAARRRAS